MYFKSVCVDYKLKRLTTDLLGPNQSLEEIPQYEFSDRFLNIEDVHGFMY